MAPRARHREEALPGFVRPGDVVRAGVMALRPPRPIGVAETAEAWRVLKNPGGGYSGPWRNSFAPYLVATMDDLTDPECGMSVLVTPTQEGKTEIILNLAVHQGAEGGADMLVFQPTRDLALDFAERRLEKAFDATPELRALIGADRSDDKVLSKVMRNAARITMGWPTSGQMSSRPVPIVVIDERDSMSDDIDGEGDPVDLGVARTKRFGRKAKVLVTSTLKRNDGSGIMARYRQGDRQLLHWQCTHCDEWFTPGFDRARRPTLAHLRIRPDATEDEARRDAIMVCPNHGCLIEERHKPAMNARAVWLADGATIAADGTIGGNPVRSRIRSRWFCGLVGRGRSWGELAAGYVRAKRELDLRQDESPLRTWWNTEFGAEYRSVLASAEALEPEALQARAEPLDLRRVPAWAGALTCAVDVQGNRFDCQAVAWGPDNRSQVVDAWQIFRTKDADGTERLVDPERRAEDWNLLTAEVLQRAWPGEAGTEYRAVSVAVDSSAYTGQAYDWWHRVRRADVQLAKRIMLLKGESRRDVPLVSIRRIEKDRDGKPLKRGIILSLINTEALKDQVDMRLRMTRPGPGWIHLPQALPDRFWEEATAETKGPKGWDKIRPRNESFDLLVYNLAAWTRRGGPRIDWNHPPDWARPRAAATPIEQLAANLSAMAAAVDALAPKPIEPKPVPPKPAVPGRSRFWKPSAGSRRLGAGRF